MTGVEIAAFLRSGHFPAMEPSPRRTLKEAYEKCFAEYMMLTDWPPGSPEALLAAQEYAKTMSRLLGMPWGEEGSNERLKAEQTLRSWAQRSESELRSAPPETSAP